MNKTAILILALVAFAGVAHAAERRLLEKSKKKVEAYKQCGGRNGCGKDKGKQCDGEEWEGYECPSGYKCDRQNDWYWQCMPTGNVNKNVNNVPAPVKLGPNEIARYQQCGGSSGACDKYGCNDCAFTGKVCEKGFKCSRKSESYWQCEPEKEVAKGAIKYCKAPPKLVKTIKDDEQDYSLEDIVKVEEKDEKMMAAPAPEGAKEVGFDQAADVNAILGETPEGKKCNAPVAEHEIDGKYMGGIFLEPTADLFGACCGACLKEQGCAGFQVNLFANATNTCEMFSEVTDVVPSSSVTAGVILLPNEVSIAGK